MLNFIKLEKKIKNKFSSKLIKLKNQKGWYKNNNGNIYHKSNQFFSIEGVRIKIAKIPPCFWFNIGWSQFLTSLFLALIARETKKKGIEFLLEAKTEPGDGDDIKFCPSYQATISNINKAHGGNKPKLSDIVLNSKGAELIFATSHNEEGGRFWKKTNYNLILLLNKNNNSLIKEKFYSSPSKLKAFLINKKVSPFVKTILFMI